MKEKFTKGDWLAVKEGVYIRHESDDQSDGMLQAIAYIESYDLPEEWEANAALIAAAPEMYEMLSALLPQIAGSPAALKVNRILSKARGEQ